MCTSLQGNDVVVTIALDGMNRCGKGVQTTLLAEYFKRLAVPVIVLRGDGSRLGSGQHPGDPNDAWWQNFKTRLDGLETEDEKFDFWNEAADRLACELIDWRRNLMPKHVRTSESSYGVILLDRSLVSRLVLSTDRTDEVCLKDLYSCRYFGEQVTWRTVLPDKLFVLDVSQEVLDSRLEIGDPKFSFRRRMILEKYHIFRRVMRELPPDLLGCVKILNGNQATDKLYRQILAETRKVIGKMLVQP